MMHNSDEIYALIKMVERTYRCRVCIIDGDGNPLFTSIFPQVDTVHLSSLCDFVKRKYAEHPICQKYANVDIAHHASKERKAFYAVCPYGGMEVITNVVLHRKIEFQLFAGVFKPRKKLPANSLSYPKFIDSGFKDELVELTDDEFIELPVLMEMLSEKISLLLESQALINEERLDAKTIVEECINGEFRKDISLSYIADKLGWSASHATVRIRKMFGKSFVQLLNERRLENAKWLLREKCYSISKIAAVSGFHSQQYFSKTFTRYCGMSPTEYRQENQQAPKDK